MHEARKEAETQTGHKEIYVKERGSMENGESHLEGGDSRESGKSRFINGDNSRESGKLRFKTGDNSRERRKGISGYKVMLATIIILAVICAVRTGILLHNYPQREIPLETVYGEDDANLVNLERTGLSLRATSTNTSITFALSGDIPVRAVEYDIANISRDNCRTYISLRGTLRQGSVLTADGKNYIEFEDAEKTDRPYELSMTPVTVRGVSFDLLRIVINPRGHLAFLELQDFLMLLAVLILFEAVLLELLSERKRNGRPSLPSIEILSVFQGFLGGLFLYLYRTEDWSELQVTWHVLALIAEGILILLIHMPASDRKKRGSLSRPELPWMRILLFSLFSFAVTELLYGDMYRLDHADSTVLNLLIYAIPYAVLYAVFGGKRRHYGYLIAMIWWLVIAMINHYYFEYREQAFELADLSMAGTARNVMGTYRLDVTPDVLFVYVACAALITGLITEVHMTLPAKPAWKRLSAVGTAVAAAVIVCCNLPYVNLWNTNIGTMHRGYALSYLSFAKKHLEKPVPAGYSAAEAEEILEQYADNIDSVSSNQDGNADNRRTAAVASGGTGSDADPVDIIVVMNEAFADLPSTYGFETDVDGLPYIHSLEGANVRKGWMLSSVFGGTTANTEYEFLTGNSTAFLGVGSVPYTQYINSDQESLARLLKNHGYSVTAFHPYLASGYKRYKVYPLLGFEKIVFSDDGLTYNDRIRTYISDEADYKNLEEIYEENLEENPDEPQFIFNITMQNHGTYSTGVPAVDVTVSPTDPDLQLSQLLEYLSLARESDAAFEELTAYFSNVDRKTVILMFGDHQPGVNNDVLRAMNPAMFEDGAGVEEQEKQYTVPYIMWANYDLPDDFTIPERTSPNYLRGYLLEAAGVAGSAYDLFAADVREEYPALNVLGWQDASGTMHDIGTLDREELLLDYKKIAYYNLFDHGKVKMELFE